MKFGMSLDYQDTDKLGMKYCLLEKMGCEAVGLINLAWCRVKWQAYVNMIMNLMKYLCFQNNIFKLKNQE